MDPGLGYAIPGRRVPRREGPPNPLGDDARVFPYGAATPRDPDPAGTGLQIKIDAPGEAESYRSGEAVTGVVSLGDVPDGVPKGARGTLTLRVYFEARTLYHDDERVFNQKTRLAKTGQNMKRYPLGHEFHRSVVSSSTHPLDASTLSSSTPTYTLPFSIPIPGELVITESSEYVNARGEKAPPRGGCEVSRAPPPTLRNHRNASVEWVVEAILHFASSSAQTTQVKADERGFINPQPPELLVARAVFPFVPRDRDLAPLYDFGPHAAIHSRIVPGFAPDPLKRTETQGAVLVRPKESPSDGSPPNVAKAIEASVASELPAVVWLKTVPLEGKLGLPGGSLIVRMIAPAGGRFERDRPYLHLLLRCRFTSASGLLGRFGAKGGKGKGKGEERLSKVNVVVMRRACTRGGNEQEGHLKFEEIRRAEHVFGAGTGEGGVEDLEVKTVEATGEEEEDRTGQGETVVYELKVAMQTAGQKAAGTSKGKGKGKESFQTPTSVFVPSFRLPNIELDYIVTINVVPAGNPIFCAARFPMQVLAGHDARTAEEAEAPPAFDWDEDGAVVWSGSEKGGGKKANAAGGAVRAGEETLPGYSE